MNISEILRGTEAGRMQSVGYMSVIPLVSEMTDERFALPTKALVQTSNYGSLEFKNPESKVMIIPTHAGYVVKQSAQDHAMSHAGLIPATKGKGYRTALCIQQSQGGTISAGEHEMLILPHVLREPALERRNGTDYSRIWHEITVLNRRFGLRTAGHLEYFLAHFEKQLDEFVAEFEIVPKQVGAIIMIDGHAVGIERAPSHAYWQAVWGPLIRVCYGSLVVQYAEDVKGKPPKNRVPLRRDVSDLDELKAAIEEAQKKEDKMAKDTIRRLVDEPFEDETDETFKNLETHTLKNKQFFGQIVKDGEKIIYASLVTTEKWNKDRDWHEAKPFRI